MFGTLFGDVRRCDHIDGFQPPKFMAYRVVEVLVSGLSFVNDKPECKRFLD
jgi:hypothetical protein